MEEFQERKAKRARKRVRNLVAKDSNYKGFVHKQERPYRRKKKYPSLDFES